MMEHTSGNSATELAQQGYDLIQARQFDEALVLSGRLQEMRYSSGFEIAALALAGRGETERAVQILEEGVAKAPDVWLNWQLLGNYRSDMGLYDSALEA